MLTCLTSKGQVTVPKRIRDGLKLLPGMPVTFALTVNGQVVIEPANAVAGVSTAAGATPVPAPAPDRFEAARGKADIRWRTDDLMKLLRADD